jgi:hypothetical protein
MGTDKLNEIGARAGELLRAFLSHDAAHIAFANTIFAIYGVCSRPGRIVDSGWFLNSLAKTELYHDFRWLGEDRGEWHFQEFKCDARLCHIYPPPNRVAAHMISLALSRHGGRKLPSTPEIDAALSDYARERAEMLG